MHQIKYVSSTHVFLTEWADVPNGLLRFWYSHLPRNHVFAYFHRWLHLSIRNSANLVSLGGSWLQNVDIYPFPLKNPKWEGRWAQWKRCSDLVFPECTTDVWPRGSYLNSAAQTANSQTSYISLFAKEKLQKIKGAGLWCCSQRRVNHEKSCPLILFISNNSWQTQVLSISLCPQTNRLLIYGISRHIKNPYRWNVQCIGDFFDPFRLEPRFDEKFQNVTFVQQFEFIYLSHECLFKEKGGKFRSSVDETCVSFPASCLFLPV